MIAEGLATIIGGKNPKPKKTRFAEAIPPVRKNTSNKALINMIFFILLNFPSHFESDVNDCLR